MNRMLFSALHVPSTLAIAATFTALAFSLTGCCGEDFDDHFDHDRGWSSSTATPDMDPPSAKGKRDRKQNATKCAERIVSGNTCSGIKAWKSLAEGTCDADGGVLVAYLVTKPCDGGAQGVQFTCCSTGSSTTTGGSNGYKPTGSNGNGTSTGNSGGSGTSKGSGSGNGSGSGSGSGSGHGGGHGNGNGGGHGGSDECP